MPGRRREQRKAEAVTAARLMSCPPACSRYERSSAAIDRTTALADLGPVGAVRQYR